ncbi:MAG: cupin domain-containing protein, partial [Clostridia bacterium]|nr:cupin domain-containing protein [Clostridia bacterium]
MYFDVKDERLYMTATWCRNIRCEEHIHTRMEFIICLEGTLHFTSGGQSFSLEEHCAAFIPPCVTHAFD